MYHLADICYQNFILIFSRVKPLNLRWKKVKVNQKPLEIGVGGVSLCIGQESLRSQYDLHFWGIVAEDETTFHGYHGVPGHW